MGDNCADYESTDLNGHLGALRAMKKAEPNLGIKNKARPEVTSGVRESAIIALNAFRREKLPYRIDHLLSSRINPIDTLVVSGFWRSGTTWLQESLAAHLKAKTVFEPLAPEAGEPNGLYERDPVPAEYMSHYMPYCDPSGEIEAGRLRAFMDKALRSDLEGRVVRLARKGLSESFRTRVILKFVRAPLLLRALQNTFSVPIIHIYRDPRAVFASVKTRRAHLGFDAFCLCEQLLEPRDGRAVFFESWRDEILEYDRGDSAARVTAYWALTELFALHSFGEGQGNIVFLSYDELCRRRERCLSEAFEQLGLGYFSSDETRILDADSWTTHRTRREGSVEKRLFGWRENLPNSEIETIESVVRRFGLADRLAC